MNDAEYKQIENNLKEALKYEKTLNQQILGRLDAYQDIMRMLMKMLIEKATEGR